MPTYNEIIEQMKDIETVKSVTQRGGGRGNTLYIDIEMLSGKVFTVSCYNNTACHVYIKYAATKPTSNADMKDTPDCWIGIYAGESTEAPTDYTEYSWNGVNDISPLTAAEIDSVCT